MTDFYDVGFDDGYNSEPRNWRLLDTLNTFETEAYEAGFFDGEQEALRWDPEWTL